MDIAATRYNTGVNALNAASPPFLLFGHSVSPLGQIPPSRVCSGGREGMDGPSTQRGEGDFFPFPSPSLLSSTVANFCV